MFRRAKKTGAKCGPINPFHTRCWTMLTGVIEYQKTLATHGLSILTGRAHLDLERNNRMVQLPLQQTKSSRGALLTFAHCPISNCGRLDEIATAPGTGSFLCQKQSNYPVLK
jgi:hypothetical protein